MVAAAVGAVAGKAAASVVAAATKTAVAVVAPVAAAAGLKIEDEPTGPPLDELAPAPKVEHKVAHSSSSFTLSPAPKLTPAPALSFTPIAPPKFVPKALPDLPAYMLRSTAAATKLPDV